MRWHARGTLWRESSLKRVAFCGRYATRSSGEVEVRRRGDAVGYAGLQSCGSVWACPVCNSKINAVRRLEVGVALTSALDWGSGSAGSAAFGAYTVRHHARMPLNPLWRSLSTCWEGVARDKKVRECRSDLGMYGTIRAAEVTHGQHGWHPHLHPVHLFDRVVKESDVADLHREQSRAWRAAALRQGLDGLDAAQHLHRVIGDAAEDMGEYFTKTTWAPEPVAWEVTSTQTKTRTRGGGRTPWDLLNAIHRDGDADALDLWHHWEQASAGKKALTWTPGLRKRLGITPEDRDEEIAARVVGTTHDVGLVVTDWAPVRQTPRLGGGLLTALATGGWDAAERFAVTHHIPHRRSAE